MKLEGNEQIGRREMLVGLASCLLPGFQKLNHLDLPAKVPSPSYTYDCLLDDFYGQVIMSSDETHVFVRERKGSKERCQLYIDRGNDGNVNCFGIMTVQLGTSLNTSSFKLEEVSQDNFLDAQRNYEQYKIIVDVINFAQEGLNKGK